MSKFIAFASVAFLAAGFMLAAPATGKAQGYGCGSYGPGYGSGYGGGYGGYTPGLAPGYGGYNPGFSGGFGTPGLSGFGSGYGLGYSNPGFSRPAVVHPQTLHWNPIQGTHTHGHIHVPHGGHSHTIPY